MDMDKNGLLIVSKTRDVKQSSNIRTSVKIFGFEFVFLPLWYSILKFFGGHKHMPSNHVVCAMNIKASIRRFRPDCVVNAGPRSNWSGTARCVVRRRLHTNYVGWIGHTIKLIRVKYTIKLIRVGCFDQYDWEVG